VRARFVLSEMLVKKIIPYSGSKIVNECTDAVADVAFLEKKTRFQELIYENWSLEESGTLKQK
jgi:hypothetical protein